MALRRKRKVETGPQNGAVPSFAGDPAGWEVPTRFNFTRDVVEAQGARDTLRKAVAYVDREGIVDRRTFADVAKDAARWAHLLRSRVERGERVLIVLGKVPAWHGAMLGALKGGLVAVPCSDMLRARDLAHRVRDSGARLVVADRASEAEIEEMQNQVDHDVTVVYLDDARAELLGYVTRAPTEETLGSEPALILYTSGTTNEPKGVVHTHAYTWAQRAQAAHWLDTQDGDVVWCTAGTGWAKSIWNVLLGPWSHAAEVVVEENAFDPETRVSLIDRLGVTILCQAPTEYRMLAKHDALAKAYLPKLRHAVSAGEPLNVEVIERFQELLGVTIHDGYGQTENSLLVANAPGLPVRPGSMGLPTPGHDIAVVDESGHVCPPGVEGEIALHGRPPTLFSGYWNAPAETDAAFRNGWYVTGDRAICDEEGYLWFVGRADDVILSAAYRIGPFEVESALLEHPAVAESAAVGVPHAERGQIVKAFVVLRPGTEGGDALVTELQDHVKAVTAPYKYPRAIEFVAELPKTASGKIRRAELRDRPYVEAPVTSSVVQLPVRRREDPTEERAARSEPDEAAAPAAAEAAQREADERARSEAEAATRAEAEARAAAEAAARAEAEARAAAEAAARAEADAQARAKAEEAARLEAEERARLEAEAAAALAAEEERTRAEAEEAARLEAEARARAEAEEQARLEAAAAAALVAEEERTRAEAAEAARAEEERLRAEAAARAAEEERLHSAAAEAARVEEERLRAQAAARAAEDERLRAAAAEAARVEEERLRAEAVARAAERERLDAEAEAARRDAATHAEPGEEERARAEAEAEEIARVEAEIARHREAADRARLEARAADAARKAAESASLEDVNVLLETPAPELTGRAARRAARDEAKTAKADAKRREEEEKRRAKEAAEQAKRDAKAAAEQAKLDAKAAEQRAKEEAVLAKQREREAAEQAKLDAKAAEQRAREEAEQRQRDEAAAREEARRREAEEKAAAKEARKKGGGLTRMILGGEEPEEPVDDSPVPPIPDIVQRLQQYSGQQPVATPPPPSPPDPGDASTAPDDDTPFIEDDESRSRSH
jgi:acyl-coenzyme A synthetase/AMP-(fatty) acid ligase